MEGLSKSMIFIIVALVIVIVAGVYYFKKESYQDIKMTPADSAVSQYYESRANAIRRFYANKDDLPAAV